MHPSPFPVCLSILFSLSTIVAISGRVDGQEKPEGAREEIQSQIESLQGAERTSKKLEVLTRFDLPAAFRLQIADELVTEFSVQSDAIELGKAYCGKATAMMHLGQLEPALEFFVLAEEQGRMCSERDPKVFFTSRCNHAACLTLLGDTPKSGRLLVEALDFAKDFGDQLDVPFVYIMMSHHAEKVGAIDMALKYLQQAFNDSVRTGKKLLAAQAGTTIVGMLAINDQHHDAQEWIVKVEPWIAEVNDPAVRLAFELHREDIRNAMGDSATAVANLRKIVDEAERLGNRQLMGNALMSISAAESTAEHYDEALSAADRAIEVLGSFSRSLSVAKRHRLNALFSKGMLQEALAGTEEILALGDDSYPQWKTLELQSQILEKLGRDKEAFAILMKSREEEQKRLNVLAREQANYMSAVFDNEQRIAELLLAKESQKAAELKSELSELNAQHQSHLARDERLLRNLALGLSLVVLAIGLLWMRSVTNRRIAMAMAIREQQLNQLLNERLNQKAAELEEEVAVRRQLEMTLERKHRDETIGKLTGGVAHDFNNLLTVIIQSIELTKMLAGPLSKEVTQLLDSSLNAAESGASIVKQLLSYARQQPLSPETIEVSKWLDTSSSLFRQIVGKVIEYRESESTEGASICVDSARLTTAIINLLANARDAVDPNLGKIELSIALETIDEQAARNWTDILPGEYVLFKVCDNGRGMNPEELSRACEPFFSTKSPSAGTGLGLSSVLGFVRQSGGDLRLKSAENGGSEVSFLLPKIPLLSMIPEDPKPSEAPKNRKRILLVEDQEQVRMVIGLCLKSMGLEVVEATNADHAIKLLENSGPLDWVLSDIRMPGSMDGMQLRNWILENYSQVQVILMSGYRESQSEVDADAIFLQKPIKPSELKQVLGVA